MLLARPCLLQGVHLQNSKLAHPVALPCQAKSTEAACQATEALLQAQNLAPPAKLPKIDQLQLRYPQVSESFCNMAEPSGRIVWLTTVDIQNLL